jgi:hypothetical protein
MFSNEPTENDEANFAKITAIRLTPEQVDRVVNSATIYSRQQNVLAMHWHPEHIPMDLIEQQIENTFPNRKDALIIPPSTMNYSVFGVALF